MVSASPVKNVFSVDVEDYFHVSAFARQIPTSQWDQFQCRVEANTHRILRILQAEQVRGTFFVLGWVAERYPRLVRDIARDGHEIGCHSHWHQLVYELTPDEFRADLRQSLDVLQQITGSAVVSYRAPSFSVVRQSMWALDILVEEGIRYDSSIFPVHHDRYGVPDADLAPCTINTGAGPLREFPPTVWRVMKMNVPIGGGGYLRLYPLPFTLHGLRKINRQEGRPFMVYTHPWEVDPDQPRLQGPRRSRFRHYVNLATTAGKLQALAREFEYDLMSAILDPLVSPEHLPVSSAREPVAGAARTGL